MSTCRTSRDGRVYETEGRGARMARKVSSQLTWITRDRGTPSIRHGITNDDSQAFQNGLPHPPQSMMATRPPNATTTSTDRGPLIPSCSPVMNERRSTVWAVAMTRPSTTASTTSPTPKPSRQPWKRPLRWLSSATC